jgi:hypothetical protein
MLPLATYSSESGAQIEVSQLTMASMQAVENDKLAEIATEIRNR